MFEIDCEKTVCFTGHRELYSSRSLIEKRVEGLILDFYQKGKDTFLCGMANGFDLLSGKVVLSLKKKGLPLKLVAVLPYPSHGSNFSHLDSELHREIRNSAEQIVIVSPAYQTGCMHKRNRFLVDNSSAVISYLLKNSGGTFYTVNYAEQKNLTIKDAKPHSASF